MQKEACGCVHGWWGDPGFRVSHIMVAWLTANVQGTIRTWCKHGHLIQRAFGPRRSLSRGYTLKRAFETVRIRSGVEEVGVHGTSSEVVVHVATVVEVVVHDGGGSCSGSWRVVV